MTDQEYADYLADPLNRAFVQEHARRQREEDQKAWKEKLESFSVFHADAPPELQALRSIENNTAHLAKVNERVYEARGILSDIRHYTTSTNGTVIDVYARLGENQEINESIARAARNIWAWHAIQTLVLLAGLLGIIATLRGLG